MSWVGTKKWIGIGSVSLVLWILLSSATYFAWIHGADHRDFYPRWAGARLALFDRRDLYSEETTRLMQITLYGAPLPPTSDQQGFAYPAQLVPLLLPFWLIGNVEVATALWEGLSILLLLWVLLALRNVWGKAPAWVVVGLLLWHYPILMIFQAQVVAIPLVAIGIGLWAYSVRRDLLAGILMGLGLIKPELVLVPLAVMLWLTIRERRWLVLKAFVLAQFILFLSSIAVAGWWMPGWLSAIARYSAYAQTTWPVGMAFRLSPLLGVILLVLGGLVLARTQWNNASAVAIGIPAGMLLLPQTLNWGLTMLLIPLVMSWRGPARWGVAGVWLLGWIWLILGVAHPDWWKIPSLLMPVFTLAVVGYASRQPQEARLIREDS
jgi:hypothetical protein